LGDLPPVSLVVPNLNNRDGLEKTLHSIRGQDFRNFELHVVDGASRDGSADIFKNFSDIISTTISEGDRGIFHAMNKGIDKCAGQYIFILPSGDILANSHVLSDFFSHSHQEDILYGNLLLSYNAVPRSGKWTTDVSRFLVGKDCLHQQASFVSRDVFKTHGLYDESLYLAEQVFYLGLAYFTEVTFKYLPYDVAIYNSTDTSFSVINADKCQKDLDDFVSMASFSSDQLAALHRRWS